MFQGPALTRKPFASVRSTPFVRLTPFIIFLLPTVSGSSLIPLDLPHELEGSVAPQGVIKARGAVSVVGPSAMQLDIHPSRPPQEASGSLPWLLYEADVALVGVEEWEYIETPDRPIAVRHTDRFEEFRNVRVWLEALHGSPHWIVLADPADPELRAGLTAAGCELTMGQKPLLAMNGRLMNRFHDPWAGTDEILEARCDASDLGILGRSAYYVYDSLLRVEGIDAETGESRTVRIDTGLFHGGLQGGSGASYELQRVVNIRSGFETKIGASGFSFDGSAEIVLRSPKFFVVGEAEIPRSSGWVRWDQWKEDGQVRSLRPQGTMVFGADDGVRVVLAGRTVNAPIADPDAAGHADPTAAQFAAFSVVAAAAAMVLGGKKLWTIAIGLFARVPRSRVLDHPVRSSILSLLEANPGLSIQEIADALDVPRSSVRHHVRVLQSNRIVSDWRAGRYHAFVPATLEVRDEDRQRLLLRSARMRQLLELLGRGAPLSQRALGERLGVSRSRVSRMIRVLTDQGLLKAQREGRRTRYRPVA